jgi:cell division protein FtsZ
LAKQRASIKVVGAGGGGNNTINRMTEVGIVGAETIAINTDAQDLLYTTADKKILLGKEITRGLGAGSIPKIGEDAAHESEHEIKQALTGADMVFITCGLGGGTGTGSAPVVAEIAKKMGALTVAVVTMPFAMEGHRRYENAVIGLEKLEKSVDTLIVIPNDKLLQLVPDLPLHTAFKVADEILTNSVKGIAELVTKAGLVNLDFADIRAVMGNGGFNWSWRKRRRKQGN